ncbi:MAG: class II aldolase/adducin family protein [Roseovarius sp.]|nr:class II aldolase/adducin family protein [Roseovarius sp.]
MERTLLGREFRLFSARLGRDPLQVQGAGGNISIKAGNVMWIKASGTELADAATSDIFAAVDLDAAKAEAFGSGDGSCKSALIDKSGKLRPSIETTFHAALDWNVVAHTHSVAALTHAIAPEGRRVLLDKLADLKPALVPYAKPGRPLTRAILARATPDTRIYVLENHGLIVTGPNVEKASCLLQEVETRLSMPARKIAERKIDIPPPVGFEWHASSWLAQAPHIAKLVAGHSYYPDHVVFLGSGLNANGSDVDRPVRFFLQKGIALSLDATKSQRAMLNCLSDVMSRLPCDWQPEPIGDRAENELLDWDAEKYRQALAMSK